MKKIRYQFLNLRHQTFCLLFAICMLLIFISSCKENITIEPADLPFNPFDTITYNNGAVPEAQYDSNSILGIHKYILSVKCAVNGCHDGSFEPDYRTVQSAYSTLVYAPVIKNTVDSSFDYRVVPFDTTYSWLYYRVTTTDQELGKMPLYDTLYPPQIKNIKTWIMDGAKDLFGNSPALPTYLPAFYGLVAYETDLNNFRVDTIRGNAVTNPFGVNQNQNLRVYFGAYDDVTFPFNFTYNIVKLSTDPFNFDNAIEVPLQHTFTPIYEDLFGASAPFWNYFDVNTAQWNVNDIVYIQVYVQDSDHSFPTALPGTGAVLYLQTYCSFIVL